MKTISLFKTLATTVIVILVAYCIGTSDYSWLLILFLLWKLVSFGLNIIGTVIRSIVSIGLNILKITFVIYLITVML